MLEPLRRTFVKALKYVPSKNEFDSLVAEWNDGIAFVQKISDETRNKPTVDAVPVVHGRWEFSDMADFWECSKCEMMLPDNVLPKEWEFCPRCGAKMDGEANDDEI